MSAAWKVERNTSAGWVFIGIVETNFAWASQWWADLEKRWGRKYRLVEAV